MLLMRKWKFFMKIDNFYFVSRNLVIFNHPSAFEPKAEA